MSLRSSFELLLLTGMSKAYRTILLAEIGMTLDEATSASQTSGQRIPDVLNEPPSTFVHLLGPPARIESLSTGAPKAYVGLPAQFFLLSLWPNLYWVVSDRISPGNVPFGATFMSQADVRISGLDPSLIRVGVWTRHALQELADSWTTEDGWDERVVLKFSFGSTRYLASFTFNLLDGWRKL